MRRGSPIIIGVGALVTTTYMLTSSAQSQIGGKQSVILQGATPGFSQSGHANISGTMIADKFSGNGASLAGLNATAITGGTLNNARLSSTVEIANLSQTISGVKTFTSTPAFTNASAPFSVTSQNLVTNLNADLLDGLSSSAFLQAVPVPLLINGAFPSPTLLDVTGSSNLSDTSPVFRVTNFSNYTTANSALFKQFAGTAVTADVTTGTAIRALATTGVGIRVDTLGSSAIIGDTPSNAGARFNGDTYGLIAGGGSVGGLFSAGPNGSAIRTDNSSGWGIRSIASGGFAGGFYHSGGIAIDVTGDTGIRYFSSGTALDIVNADTGVRYLGSNSAVNAETNGTSSIAGRFESTSTSGDGLHGINVNASLGGSQTGVVGRASTLPAGAVAVQATGRFAATGTKSFRIDHPHDPLNKYLLHYSTESPFPQNFYNGNVRTDSNGYAWVDLPSYFEDINTDYKYVLTVIDDEDRDEFVQVKVSKRIRNNRFQIRTSLPNVDVSWRIDANRNDMFVRKSPPTDEMSKPDRFKGTYQHPELYDAPASMGMYYKQDQMAKRHQTQTGRKSKPN